MVFNRAKDDGQATFAAVKDDLIGMAQLETQQKFLAVPTLGDLRHFLLVICDELEKYQVWPVREHSMYLAYGVTLQSVSLRSRQTAGFSALFCNSTWRGQAEVVSITEVSRHLSWYRASDLVLRVEYA